MTHAQLSGNATLVDRIQGQNSPATSSSCTTRWWRTQPCPEGLWRNSSRLRNPFAEQPKRAHIRAVSMTDAEATMELESHQRKKMSEESAGVLLAGQLVMLAELKPRKFRTRMQRLAYEGPTARRDAEADVRSTYLRILANILKNTETPMGQLLREDPKNIDLLGAGRRASTMRSRVRGVVKSSWDGWRQAHNLAFPDSWRHYSEFLQVRLAEPCVRGALKHTIRATYFSRRSQG